jgi:outer membrane protein assembly factor BamB
MKLLYAFIFIFIFHNCSFDTKTGIWESDKNLSKKKDIFKEFKTIYTETETFDKIIPLDKNFRFKTSGPIKNYEWKDIFYDKKNNTKNFNYTNLNNLIFKSKKLSRNKIDKYILFENNNILFTDIKGNLIIYSINKNKIITKFNFYKKKYKKIKKKLNIIVENEIIYISDNIGYLYAYDYKQNKIKWAKDYKIPFRSNLKLSNNNLIAANQNNSLIFFNKINGELIKLLPTEETVIKNKFINNLSLDDNSLFFLNSYGSLYSFNKEKISINWFLNLNKTINLNPNNLFFGNQIINDNDHVIVNSNDSTYVLNSQSGEIIYKFNVIPVIKPLIFNKNLFLISSENLLICFSLENGKIIYSYNINDKIADFLNIKKQKVDFKNIIIVNNDLFVFLKNSYVLKFKINGDLKEVTKLPAKLYTSPIFIDDSIIFMDSKNKISIVD